MFEEGASSGLMAALFTSGHRAAPPGGQRQPRPRRPVRPPDPGRRADREPGRHRARRRVRRRRDPDDRAARDGDRLRRQRHQDVHHQWRARRLRHHGRSHRWSRPLRASACSWSRRARPGSPSTGRWPRWAGTAPTPPSSGTPTCGCPCANLVGEENSGFAQIAEQFVVERIALAVHAYGIAGSQPRADRGVLPRARDVRQAVGRQPGGAPSAGRDAAARRGRAHLRPRVRPRRYVAGEDVIAEACLAKQTAVDASTYVCDQAVQLHGGAGYLHGTEVERHYRDARILPIGGGATEVLTDLAARLLGYAS